MDSNSVTRCPHCGKPFTSRVNEFEAVTATLPGQPTGNDDFTRWITLAGLGAGSTALAMALSSWPHPPYWIAPIIGLGVAVGLETFVIWLHRPVTDRRPHQVQSHKITAEIRTEDNRHWVLRDFAAGIELGHIWFVAYRLLEQQASFTRSDLCDPRYLSQPKFHEIRKTLVALGLCVRGANNVNRYTLTLSGRHFLRQVLRLPCPIPGLTEKHPPR